jgi:glycosyltransferase involved in cell wall biosynthesis/lipopolysaccharide biosynthesis protein
MPQKSHPLVSVIVPCYNQAHYLSGALGSVMSQTYLHWECIIVNDGSPDNTESVASEWMAKDARFKYVHKPNGGLSSARNAGIQQAQGEYILPLDADDRLGENYIEVCLQSLLTDTNCKISYGQGIYFGIVDAKWELPEYDFKHILVDNMIFCTALFSRKDWELNHGYDENLVHGHEDWEFWINLLKRGGRAVQNQECTFYYRVKEKSMYKSLAEDIQKLVSSHEYIWSKHKELYVSSELSFDLLKRMNSQRINLKVWLNQTIDAHASQIAAINAQLAERDLQLAERDVQLAEIYKSKAWKLVLYLRKIRVKLFPPRSLRSRIAKSVLAYLQKNINMFKKEGRLHKNNNNDQSVELGFLPAVASLLQKHGGIKSALWKAFRLWRNHGIRFFFYRFSKDLSQIRSASVHQTSPKTDPIRQFNIVPYYLNPYYVVPAKEHNKITSVGIHLHLDSIKTVDICVSYLKNIPVPFSLYLSFSYDENSEEITRSFQENLSLVGKITICKTPRKGGHLAPLIVEFGRELLRYDLIVHLHTLDSLHFQETIEGICASDSTVHQIIQILQQDGRFVYHESNRKNLLDSSGWGENFPNAKKIAEKLLKENLDEYQNIDFPQEGMFWATSSALKNFLSLAVKYDDFSDETIGGNNVLHETLLRLLLISANTVPGRNYRLYAPDTTIHEPAYEEHRDYSKTLKHNSVKALSFYLPQFYPIPENDAWHGKGFTEWSKVRSTNPLFYNHYQQRIPHDDLGYYSLTNTDALRKQSVLMKQAGVYGQVFYHYWFSGKLILEKPIQMLLADPSIDMPFCFCWANENWTRKWDGNESEILLQQNYSEQDAIDFINYLLPFFQDQRYITIENRPVLFVYRPSSIPDFSLYKRVWKDICHQNNIAEPYVVAILTRGATTPHEFGMDAGCERVLHDWTNGAVPNIKDTLYQYWPVNASVLDYNQVADHYMEQSPTSGFTYFRSIIPSWDNTPRYGSDALIIHNSSPQKFQQWLQNLVLDAKQRLPEDRQFILINAWNEWAESATLDPDKRFGYAYLNSIGKALSDISYNDCDYLQEELSGEMVLAIDFEKHVIETLQTNEEQKQKILSCLVNSTIFSQCKIAFKQQEVQSWVQALAENGFSKKITLQEPDYTIQINSLCYLTPNALENMLKLAIRYGTGMVIPTVINDEKFTHASLGIKWECPANLANISPMLLINNTDNSHSTLKCCVDAKVFITTRDAMDTISPDVVSTIIRFHKTGNFELLENALYSLLAQTACIVQPILAVQDLSQSMLAHLHKILRQIPFSTAYPPVVKEYYSDTSCSDLRALMLNQELRLARTEYVAFLDYDDILFPNAYHWLLTRLKRTNKNATFGLIYTASCNLAEKKIKHRSINYDTGKTFSDFYNNNHTPIHGFMINKSKINTENINFFKCMKYMEDYYMTLQIFTEKETDWESLYQQKFIGDYYCFEDKSQTLGNLNDSERLQILQKNEYIDCQKKIDEIRRKIKH